MKRKCINSAPGLLEGTVYVIHTGKLLTNHLFEKLVFGFAPSRNPVVEFVLKLIADPHYLEKNKHDCTGSICLVLSSDKTRFLLKIYH